MNNWQKSPQFLTLNDQEIHIWRGHLDLPLTNILIFKQYLSSDEIKRSDRFKFDIHRHRYIASRGILRIILSKYLNIDPFEVNFHYSSKGKPQIIVAQNQTNLEFNLSNSQDLSLYGITKKNALGIDVEYTRKMSDMEQIANRFFTPKECQILQSVSEAEKTDIFFQLWTAKEAYLKCTGQGITGGLDKFEVIFKDHKSIGLLGLENDLKEISNWYFKSFKADHNYQSTVVVNSQENFSLKYFNY